MFSDRDLAILGCGAFLAAGCLLLPLPLTFRIVLGASLFFGAMLAALLRLGPDRVALERWLLRRIRFQFRPRRYVYPENPVASAGVPPDQPETELPGTRHWPPDCLVPLLLTALGVDLVLWLWQGGAVQISAMIRAFFH